jgi:hypothetical protein
LCYCAGKDLTEQSIGTTICTLKAILLQNMQEMALSYLLNMLKDSRLTIEEIFSQLKVYKASPKVVQFAVRLLHKFEKSLDVDFADAKVTV